MKKTSMLCMALAVSAVLISGCGSKPAPAPTQAPAPAETKAEQKKEEQTKKEETTAMSEAAIRKSRLRLSFRGMREAVRMYL